MICNLLVAFTILAFELYNSLQLWLAELGHSFERNDFGCIDPVFQYFLEVTG
jgi:hypothetical protein